MVNIVLVISKFPPEYSGPGVRIPRLYHWLQQEYGFDFQIFSNSIELKNDEIYTYEGFLVKRIVAGAVRKFLQKIFFLPSKLKHGLAYQADFIKCFISFLWDKKIKNVDLLHVVGHSGGTSAALLYAKIKNIPVLMELVNDTAHYRQKYFFIFKTPIIDKLTVIALTEAMVKKCVNDGLDPLKVWYRPNPIDIEVFNMPMQDDKNKLRSSLLDVSVNKTVLLAVAKIMPRKNQIFLLEVLKHLPNNYILVIAGPLVEEGPLYQRDLLYLKKMKQLAKDLEIENRIRFVVGYVESDKYMKVSDLYMMPAWNEGLGTPMLEAMACGIPVVANSQEAAFQEWIKNGINGHLCDIDNPKQWADSIQKITNLSYEERKNISKSVTEQASKHIIYSDYKRVIDQLLR